MVILKVNFKKYSLLEMNPYALEIYKKSIL